MTTKHHLRFKFWHVKVCWRWIPKQQVHHVDLYWAWVPKSLLYANSTSTAKLKPNQWTTTTKEHHTRFLDSQALQPQPKQQWVPKKTSKPKQEWRPKLTTLTSSLATSKTQNHWWLDRRWILKTFQAQEWPPKPTTLPSSSVTSIAYSKRRVERWTLKRVQVLELLVQRSLPQAVQVLELLV